MATYFMDKWGRKAVVFFVPAVRLVGRALVYAAQGVVMFLVFRFFAGVASWGALTISELPALSLVGKNTHLK